MVFRTASGLCRGPLLVTAIALVCSSILGVQAAYAAGDPDVAPAPRTPLRPPTDSVAAASSAGYLPGAAGVTPTGAFTYAIPLDVPAGRAGMAPRLSLNYSSAAGDGPLGQGWAVSGAGSSITRCGKTPEVEGTRTGVRYDRDDVFCLDGQKLIGGGLAETFESGEYGGHYTRYRELHGAFSDIVSLNPSHDLDAGPDRFIVYGKDGRIREYTPHSAKQTEESTSLVKSKAIGGGVVLSTASPRQYSRNEKNPRVAWLLSKERDRSGNEVRYSYYELGVITGAGIEFLIKRIDYTYGPDTEAERYVEFEYELRPDKSFSYVAGVRYGHNWRLAHVRMYAPNPVTTSLVYAYHLGYLPTGPNLFDRKRSLLASVQKCGEQNGCLPTRKFNWPTHTLPSFGSTPIEDLTIDTRYDQDPPGGHVLDLDGDGLDDLVYNPSGNDSGETARLGTRDAAGTASPLADARPLNGVGDWPELNGGDTGSLPNINLAMSRPVDLKSDGLAEFMLRDRRWTQPPWNYGEFDNKDTILRWDARDHKFVSTGTRFDTTWLGETDYVDLNGDGLLDYIASPLEDRDFPEFDQFWSFRLQDGNGGFGPATVVGDGFYEYPGNCPGARAFDADGDGRGNLVFDDGDPEFNNCGRNQLRRVDMADDGTHSVTENVPALAPGGEEYADGYTQEDSVILPPLRHQSYASLGQTTLKENGLWRWISTLGDFNGDGLLDAVLLPRYAPGPFADWYRGLILWNTGTGLRWDGSRLDLPHDDLGDLRVGDLNGDGRDDLVSFYHTGLTIDTNDSTTAADDEIVYSGGAQRVSVLLSNGDGTFVDDAFSTLTAGTPRADVGRPLSQLGDFNGDGRLDLVAAGNDKLTVMLQNEPPYGSAVQDRIVSVADEGAASGRYGVVYSNKWTDHQENMGGTCVLPLVCVRRGMPVVRQLISYEQTFAPGDQAVSTYYSYHDPVVHPTQGFLGFGTTRTWAPSRPVEIVTTYDVRSSAGDGGKYYPFGSLPKTVTTTVPVLSLAEVAGYPTSVGRARVSRTTYTHAFRYLTNTSGPSEVQGDFAVFPSRVHTAEWHTAVTIDWSTSLAGPTKPVEHLAEYQGAEPASPGRITDEMATFDDYGNLTNHHSVTNGGVTEDVVTEFDNSTQAHFDWLISLAKRQRVTRTEPTIVNNGFETNLRGWSVTPGLVSVDASFARSGVSGVRLSPPRPEVPSDPLDSVVTQRFTVPSDSGTLSFWYKPSCGQAGAYARVTLLDETTQATSDALAPVCTTAGWTKVSAPVTPGHQYTVTFRNHSASAAGASNATLLDDVLLSGASTQVTRTVDNTFDALGRLRKTELEKGTVDTNQSTSYDLDGLGVLTKVTTSAPNLPDRVTNVEYAPVFSKEIGGLTVFQPDERIHPSQLWSSHDLVVNGQHDPVSYRPSIWQAVHPAFGTTVATEDINGAKSSTEWDDLGRPVKITTDGAPTTHLSYGTSTDINGKLNGTRTTTTIETGVADPAKKNTTVVVADQLGRARQSLTTGFDGATIKADTGYDILGRPANQSGPYTATKLRETLSFYDSLDRPTQTILPHPTGALYDLTWEYPDFLVTSATDQRGNRTDTTVDPDGRPARVDAWQVVAGTYQPNVTTTYGYAPFDLQNKGVDDLGNTTTMSYDVLGRRTKLVDPDRGTVSTSYYGTGEVHVETHEGTGNSSTYGYDDLGRKIRTEDHDEAANQDRVTTFSWDTAANGIGRLAEAVSPDNIRTGFRYDTLGRHQGTDYTIDAGAPYSTEILYDGKGRVSTIGYPQVPGRARFTVQNTYNDYGFAADVLDATPGQPAATLWHTTSRNADLALTGATMADGGSVTLSNTYHQQTGQLINTKAEKAATRLQDITYGYYENGLLYTRSQNDSTVTNRNETYHLDELGRLTRWLLAVNGVQKKDAGYSYDTTGNITPAGEERYYGNSNSGACTAGHAGPHALCWVDALDNTGINTYSYDGQGRETLDEHEDGTTRATTYTAFDLPKTITDGGVSTTFDYDAFGTRVRKSGPSGTTVYLPGLFEKRTTTGGATSYVFYVNGPAGPIGQAVYDGTGTTMEYVLTDALGSTGASLSAAGAVTGSFHYEPFGRRTTADGTPSGAPTGNITHGFTGHEMDDGLGLINMAGRLYDPAKKAMLTTDPVLTNHPYAYASNNPTSFIDPTGYDDFPIFGGNSGPGPSFGGVEGVESTNAESWEWVVGDTKFSCVGGENAYSCKGIASASKTPTGNVGSDESGYSAAADYSFEYSPGLTMMANFDAFAEGTGLNSFLDWWDTVIAEAPIGGYDNNNLGFAEADQEIMVPVTNGEFATQSAGALATVLVEIRALGLVARTATAGGAPAGGAAVSEAMLGLSEADGFAVQVVTRSRGTATARLSRGLLTFDGNTNGYKALVAMSNYSRMYPNTRWIVGVGTHGGVNGTWSGTQALRAVPGFDAAAALPGRAKNFATALSKLGMKNAEVFDLADEAGVAAFRAAEMNAVGQPNAMVIRAWCHSTLSCP